MQKITRHHQLDSMRWFAVLGVMLSHYLPDVPLAHLGSLGVKTFFTLSGFLIGGILFNMKGRLDNKDGNLGSELWNFYARRTLRIFPAFYVLLIACWFLGNWDRSLIAWASLYAINIHEVIYGGTSGIFGHLYTLCIEEHFYLCFPLLILLPKRNYIPWILCLLVASALSYRVLFLVVNPLTNGSRLLFSELDSLALGAGLAWLRQQHPESNRQFFVALQKLGPLSGLLFLGLFWLNQQQIGTDFFVIAGSTMFAIFSSWMIHNAANGVGGIIGRILDFKPFIWLGTLSYGIYLFHNFAGWFTINAAIRLGIDLPEQPWIRVMIYVTWSLVAATASWYAVESPCNSLKRYFTYGARSKTSK